MGTGTKANENLHKSREPLRISAHTLYCQNLESLGYIVVADSTVYLHSNIHDGLRMTHVF